MSRGILLLTAALLGCFLEVDCVSVAERMRGFGKVLLRQRREPDPGRGTCALLAAPWTESRPPDGGDWGQVYRLKVLPMSREGAGRPVFPEQPLFRFVRRVYRCCQAGLRCGSVKGLQGREAAGECDDLSSRTLISCFLTFFSGFYLLTPPGSSIEFLLSEDVMSAMVVRAEIHVHLTNPQHLNIQPLLPSLEKRRIPTRYSAGSKDGVLELRVDLTFLFQALQQTLGGGHGGPSLLEMRRLEGLSRPWVPVPRDKALVLQDSLALLWGEGGRDRAEDGRPLQAAALELGLVLYCSTVDSNTQACPNYGVRLLHTPFITLSYR